MYIQFRLAICAIICFSFQANCQSEMVAIDGGTYIPLYGRAGQTVEISDFEMDVYPVSNADYLVFVKRNPSWRKSQVISLFADERYLVRWENDTTLGSTQLSNAPATDVSWYAAKAYCACQDKRLATIDEWEYVAMSDETVRDARKNESYNAEILLWYEKPRTYNNEIGSTFKNYWNVYDLHGLVWEWTLDFNSVLVSGESRKDVDKDSNLFCGSAAVGANDLMNYAAFMRYATRGSLKARYTMQNLGFRCVK